MACIPCKSVSLLGSGDPYRFCQLTHFMFCKKFFILLLSVWAISCSKNDITPPPDITHNNLDGTSHVNLSVAKQMEGIYQLKSGSNALGSQFVCKISKTKVSFFVDASGLFFILD